MLPLLFFALTDTSVVQIPSDMVFIHEWGVIEVDEEYLTLRGAPDGWVDELGYVQDYPMADVTAPVVYFHGAECTGTFTVDVYDGYFTMLLPYPDSVANAPGGGPGGVDRYTAVWEDLIIRHVDPLTESTIEATDVTRGPSMPDCFSWAVPLWREVPANRVSYPATGYEDVFLYYESGMLSPEMFMGEYYGHIGDALLFFPEDGELTCSRVTVPGERDAIGETLSDLEIMAVLCHWADNGLKTEEIGALWKTWEPLLATRCELGGETLMLFPLSSEEEESVSRLRFVPDDGGLDITYDRLLLGLGAV